MHFKAFLNNKPKTQAASNVQGTGVGFHNITFVNSYMAERFLELGSDNFPILIKWARILRQKLINGETARTVHKQFVVVFFRLYCHIQKIMLIQSTFTNLSAFVYFL